MSARVLIVDDEEKITRIYKSLLATEGYDALEAHDGHRATNLLITKGDIHLVLLDIHMPWVNGVTIYEIVKQVNPAIKVIVTSVYSSEDQKNLIVEANDYFDKSQGTEILLSKVKRVLSEDIPR